MRLFPTFSDAPQQVVFLQIKTTTKPARFSSRFAWRKKFTRSQAVPGGPKRTASGPTLAGNDRGRQAGMPVLLCLNSDSIVKEPAGAAMQAAQRTARVKKPHTVHSSPGHPPAHNHRRPGLYLKSSLCQITLSKVSAQRGSQPNVCTMGLHQTFFDALLTYSPGSDLETAVV